MLQTIVRAYPPNFEAILKRFPVAINKGVFFSYGDKIYNPSGVSITKQLRAHEAEHGRRRTRRQRAHGPQPLRPRQVAAAVPSRRRRAAAVRLAGSSGRRRAGVEVDYAE